MNILFILLWAMLWLSSIGMFLYIFFLKGSVQNLTNIELTSIVIVIIIGIVSFFSFLNSIEKMVKKKYPRVIAGFLFILAFLASLAIGIGIIFVGFNVLPKAEKIPVEAEKTNYTLLQSPLKVGSSGEEVKILQAVLRKVARLYPSGVVSGYYGQLTKEAVINFQAENGLPQTGEINEATISKINEVYGSQPKEWYLSNVPSAAPARIIPQTQTNVDSDPIVNCIIHEKCGGGSTRIKKSVCDNSICCTYPDRNVFYLDKNQCNSSNNTTSNQQNDNTTQTTTTNYTFPTTPPQNNTVQNPTSPPQQQAVDNTAAREQCIGNVNSTLSNDINSLRNYCRSIGSGGSCNDTTNLESQANAKRAQCNSMYP